MNNNENVDVVQQLAKRLDSNSSNINEDFQEMISSFMSTMMVTMEQKYLNHASLYAKEHTQNINSSPPKEVNLLRAITPFLPEVQQNLIGNVANKMMLAESFKGITNSMRENTVLQAREISEDENSLNKNSNSKESTDLAGVLLLMELFKNSNT